MPDPVNRPMICNLASNDLCRAHSAASLRASMTRSYSVARNSCQQPPAQVPLHGVFNEEQVVPSLINGFKLTLWCVNSGCSVELIRVVWSVSPAWEAVELTLGDRLHLPVRGPRPYRFGSDNRGCSRTNAWRFSTFPRRRLSASFSKASTVTFPLWSIALS
jgi:hypothetical protein